MKYEVSVTRIGYASMTVAVEANSPEEAKEKAETKAEENGGWDEDSYEIKADDEEPIELTEEEYQEYYGEE